MRFRAASWAVLCFLFVAVAAPAEAPAAEAAAADSFPVATDAKLGGDD